MNLRRVVTPLPYLFRRPLLLAAVLYALALVVCDRCGLLGFPPDHALSHVRGRPVVLTGVVAGTPEVRPGRQSFPFEVESCGARSVAEGDRPVTGPLRIGVFLRGEGPVPLAGDRLRLRGFLTFPAAPSNPGQFDLRRLDWRRGWAATLFASRHGHGFARLGDSGRYRLRRLAQRVSLAAAASLKARLSPEAAAVISGVALGVKPHGQPEVERAFRDSGTTHVLVASGSNVAFVVGLGFCLGRRLGRLSRRAALSAALPLGFCYAGVAGADPPVLRAVVMSVTAGLGILIGREDRTHHALGAAALTLLLIDPRALFDPSFQMSFAAVFGLVHFEPIWGRLLRRAGARAGLAAGFGASLSAALWLAPLLLLYFNRATLIGPVANLIVVPLAGAGLQAGLALAGLDALSSTVGGRLEWLSWGAARACEWIAGALLTSAKLFAECPGSGRWFPPPAAPWTVIYYALLFVLPWAVAQGDRSPSVWRPAARRRALCVWAVFSVSLSLWPVWGRAAPAGAAWLDAGAGLVAVIHGRPGRAILVVDEPGRLSPGAVRRVITPYLAHRGVRCLEALIAGDGAEGDGMDELMATIPIRRVQVDSRPLCLRIDFGKQIVILAGKGAGALPSSAFPAAPGAILSWPDLWREPLGQAVLDRINPGELIVTASRPMPRHFRGVAVSQPSLDGAISYRGSGGKVITFRTDNTICL